MSGSPEDVDTLVASALKLIQRAKTQSNLLGASQIRKIMEEDTAAKEVAPVMAGPSPSTAPTPPRTAAPNPSSSQTRLSLGSSAVDSSSLVSASAPTGSLASQLEAAAESSSEESSSDEEAMKARAEQRLRAQQQSTTDTTKSSDNSNHLLGTDEQSLRAAGIIMPSSSRQRSRQTSFDSEVYYAESEHTGSPFPETPQPTAQPEHDPSPQPDRTPLVWNRTAAVQDNTASSQQSSQWSSSGVSTASTALADSSDANTLPATSDAQVRNGFFSTPAGNASTQRAAWASPSSTQAAGSEHEAGLQHRVSELEHQVQLLTQELTRALSIRDDVGSLSAEVQSLSTRLEKVESKSPRKRVSPTAAAARSRSRRRTPSLGRARTVPASRSSSSTFSRARRPKKQAYSLEIRSAHQITPGEVYVTLRFENKTGDSVDRAKKTKVVSQAVNPSWKQSFKVPEGAVSAKFLIRLQTDNGSQVIATGECRLPPLKVALRSQQEVISELPLAPGSDEYDTSQSKLCVVLTKFSGSSSFSSRTSPLRRATTTSNVGRSARKGSVVRRSPAVRRVSSSGSFSTPTRGGPKDVATQQAVEEYAHDHRRELRIVPFQYNGKGQYLFGTQLIKVILERGRLYVRERGRHIQIDDYVKANLRTELYNVIDAKK